MNLKCYSLLTTMFLLANSSHALDSDRYQPIRIQANNAMVHETEGTSSYWGNVIIQQGTLQVTADEVEIYTGEKNEVIQISTLGIQKIQATLL